jgi:hypothetical protein
MALQLFQRPPLALVGRAGPLHARTIHPLEASRFTFVFREWRRGVLIEQPCFRSGKVALGEGEHGQGLPAAVGAADSEFISNTNVPVRFATRTVDFDLAAFARALCFGAGPIQAGNIQPDVQAYGCRGLIHVQTMFNIGPTLAFRGTA